VGARHESCKELIATYWETLYNFALRMCLDEDRARTVVEETFLRAYVGADSAPAPPQTILWLFKISQHVLSKKLGRTPEVSFDLLDRTLRSEATRTDVVRSLAEPKRDFLLWELKQGCMTSVVNCLSPGERAAFVLSVIMKLSDSQGAQTLDISAEAYRLRLFRAKKKIADYLAPRCEHVDPGNPCRCPARIGVALSKGFISSGGVVSLRKPPQSYGKYGVGPTQEDKPQRDITAIYGGLPKPRMPEDLYAHLIEQVDNGCWDAIRERGQDTVAK
jgi:DNA-directed RNA polymerase specialized sigma24 family protein